MTARIEHTVTSGTFSLDGGTWDVDNNVWVVGDDKECVIIDAPHTGQPILDLVGRRRVIGLLCTHAHDDHVTAAPELARRTGAPVWLHPGDEMLWRQAHPREPFRPITDGQAFTVAGVTLQALHTPGHSPGSVCFYAPDLETVFSGDTLFHGGPGATGRSYSDFGTIIDSITTSLLTLPAETEVLTGHGESTTIGAEAPQREDWIARGH